MGKHLIRVFTIGTDAFEWASAHEFLHNRLHKQRLIAVSADICADHWGVKQVIGIAAAYHLHGDLRSKPWRVVTTAENDIPVKAQSCVVGRTLRD